MRLVGFPLLALWLLPVMGYADQAPPPWAASAETPTSFAVPVGQDAAVMAQAVSLLNGWKGRDSRMYPMPIQTSTVSLIQTQEPTAMGLFGVKITDTHTAGVALIAIETSAYEGKILEVGREHRDAAKRAHLLAYLLEQFAGVTLTPIPAPAASAALAPMLPAPTSAADTFEPDMQRLRSQLDAGQYGDALATLDTLRAAVVAREQVSAQPGH